MLVLDGEAHSVTAWAEITGLTKQRIIQRLREGWTVRDTLLKPIRQTVPGKGIQELNRWVATKRSAQAAALNLEQLAAKKAELAEMEQVRANALAFLKRMKTMGESDRHYALAAEYGERKVQACQRLKREQRLQPFRTLVARYRRELKQYNVGRSILFYLALREFPPLTPDDGI